MNKPKKKKKPVAASMTDVPCPICLELAKAFKIRTETVQPLPAGVLAPLARDGRRCCFDCQAAETVVRMKIHVDFEMARIAVGNDRQEQLRLPGAPLGLVGMYVMKPNAPGDLDRHHAWLDKHDWFGIDEDLAQ